MLYVKCYVLYVMLCMQCMVRLCGGRWANGQRVPLTLDTAQRLHVMKLAACGSVACVIASFIFIVVSLAQFASKHRLS